MLPQSGNGMEKHTLDDAIYTVHYIRSGMYFPVRKTEGSNQLMVFTDMRMDSNNYRQFGYKPVDLLTTQRRTEGKLDPRGEEGITSAYSTDGD